MIALMVLVGCSFLEGPPIPQPVVEQIAEELCGLGHPNAEYVSATMTGWQSGGMTTKTHDRFVDIDIKYRKKKDDHDETMTVRLYLENPAPCRVSMDVLEDTGKKPVMLDNALASEVVGKAVCDSMSPM